jgi:phosphoribosylformimino-5-aminoimidazole carboxamide ribotide isomerase
VLIPCIDLQHGQAVQLVQGRRCALAVADVMGLLDRFSGYPWLHVIDLDAAMRKGQNNHLVQQLSIEARRRFRMKVRVGGGIRTVRRAAMLQELGVHQIIVGSAAFRRGRINFPFLRRLAARIGKKQLIVALDTAKGRIVTHGWSTSLSMAPNEVFSSLAPYCGGFLCTDVDREGTMGGVNFQWFRSLRQATRHPIIAAGGISTSGEVRALEKIGMDSAVGMALYKNRVR